MRLLHRWIAPFAVLFLAIWNAYGRPARAPQALPADEISHWVNTTVAAAQRAQPQGAIAMFSLRIDRAQPRADVIWTSSDIPALSLDPRTGNRFQPSVAEDQSVGCKLARLMVQLHRGDLFGLPGRWIGLACGIALLAMGLTGLVMYVKIYGQRIRLRRWSPVW